MKMIRHHDKFMKLISPFVATDENASNQYLGNFLNSEQFASLPSAGGSKICTSREYPVKKFAHRSFRAEAPSLTQHYVGAKAPTSEIQPKTRSGPNASIPFVSSGGLASGGPGFSPAVTITLY